MGSYLAQSELWGHIKGAFTGAVTAKKGQAEEAEGGTLFLDEVATLEPAVQNQLLRFIQFKKYKVLGTSREKKANVRFICATNTNLRDEAVRQENRFRDDLYFRLEAHVIDIEPLRERRGNAEDTDDFDRLVDNAIQRYNATIARRYGKIKGLEESALPLLRDYEWPGNVRELNNVMAAACAKAVRSKNRIVCARHVADVFEELEITHAKETYPHLQRTICELYEDHEKNPDDPKLARVFMEAVNKLMNDVGGVIQDAAVLAKVSRQTMGKYVREAKLIYERM